MVAAARGDRRPPLTVRPVGPPFERRLALSAALERRFSSARGRGVAIVDEGPGLSGSSFGAVVDAACAAGVAEEHVHVMPAHVHLGARASTATRARWRRLALHPAPVDALVAGAGGGPGLREWTEDLTGPQDGPPEDVSAGRWRAHVYRDRCRWPPVCAARERRKYLLRAGGRVYLARFAGLGEAGRSVAARAQRLAGAGLSPAVLGLRHGFLVQPWLVPARPLPEARALIGRRPLLGRVEEYLAFRAAAFQAAAGRGASPAALLELALVNAREGVGARAEARLSRFAPWLASLARDARPVEIDGRCHAWEWLVLPDGRVLKCDAFDHCDGHDPVGCQDIAWDVAGAAVELELAAEELAPLLRRLRRAGCPLEAEPLAFYRGAYLAFQLGLHHAAAAAEADPLEARRLAQAAARYAGLLARDGEAA
jgi:hypothetical protein